ncbi:hypothetical protein BU24DRAFT_418601 [Aaosphaeria arxii CBS 175.79]|uniref:Leo1-domain-containing protein n=1 Tax=Aaosphaeria arxii CBS 175.79 TaxID=1450172 RepID=A0A6A5Y1E0_9PLEO|nr:uncharacterized protein BU24DRAFT_418601 [Aaosphaeria arxii CBS 175.79]KAF2019013.1 hypothetical protein BU24DRAFT_418601 [Aaosphaeria arxii CBS 175.79]
MASAVAVDASASAPSLPDNLSDDEPITGKVGPVDSDDDGEPRDTVEENGLDDDEDDDDLFGDGGDDEEDQPALRTLDDEDLDSGDDEGRTDRAPEVQEVVEEEEQQTLSFMDADIARHAVPEPSDGELYLLKVPRFLSIEPTAFNHKTFRAPTTDHHSKGAPSEHFSPYDTALSTIRWRRSPSNPGQLQSNARVLRWSDGSLTLQFASKPLDQYEINANPLAPPQIKPKKPTPTSLTASTGAQYKEGYTYLAAPYEEAQVMRITNKLTTGLSVVPTNTSKDDAIERLQSALAMAANRGKDDRDQAISFIDVNEDPELKRAREEASVKEKLRQQRAREKTELRERERASRRTGGGASRSAGYGISSNFLEDEDGGRRGGARKPRQRNFGRDMSDDEDYGRGRNREDEYDEDDGFIAASDEEPEIMEDDDDLDEDILESPPRRARETQSPKRNRDRDDDEEDDDQEVVVSRTKRRRVIDDDDEDE